MFAQVEKSKENESELFSSSILQKKLLDKSGSAKNRTHEGTVHPTLNDYNRCIPIQLVGWEQGQSLPLDVTSIFHGTGRKNASLMKKSQLGIKGRQVWFGTSATHAVGSATGPKDRVVLQVNVTPEIREKTKSTAVKGAYGLNGTVQANELNAVRHTNNTRIKLTEVDLEKHWNFWLSEKADREQAKLEYSRDNNNYFSAIPKK